jgi:hypothetical protein
MSKHLPSAPDPRSLWERAAELDRERAPPEEGGPLLSADARELSVAEMVEVGREVGISPDSVLLSVAEGRLPDGNELKPRRESPLWHRILIEVRDAVEVPLRLAVPPDVALQLLDEVMERQEYRMSLEDRMISEEDEASVSVFRNMAEEGVLPGSEFHGTLHLTDGRVLVIAVLPDPEGGSRIRIRMPLYERGVNLTISGVSGGVTGAGGASLGTALGEAMVGAVLGGATGILPLAMVVAPAVVGAYMGVGAGILGFRKLQRWGFGKGQSALVRLARALELEAESWLREEST